MSQRNEEWAEPEIDGVSHWLIHHAASWAPEALSSRLEEEWLADLECRSSALSRLGLALGCCWATVVIANEFSRTRVPTATPVVAAKGYITLADRNFGYFSLRSGTRGSVTQPDLPNQVLNPVPIEVSVLPGR